MKNTNQEKIKRILAGAGAVLLILMYISTLIFALIGSPNAIKLLWASIASTIVLPVLLYGIQLAFRVTKNEDEDNTNLLLYIHLSKCNRLSSRKSISFLLFPNILFDSFSFGKVFFHRNNFRAAVFNLLFHLKIPPFFYFTPALSIYAQGIVFMTTFCT